MNRMVNGIFTNPVLLNLKPGFVSSGSGAHAHANMAMSQNPTQMVP